MNSTKAPPRPANIGKIRCLTAIDGAVRCFKIVDEIVRKQKIVENASQKLIYFQKLRFEVTRRVEYRFTYYMLGLKPGAKGRWVFGQYSLLLPPSHLSALLKEARRRGWKGV